MTTPRFKRGDKVTARGFLDCFGKRQPDVPDLTVTDVRKVDRIDQPPYYRVTAEKPYAKISMVEGAEWFFEPEGAANGH